MTALLNAPSAPAMAAYSAGGYSATSYNAASSLSPLSVRDNSNVDSVAKEFESVFLSQMMQYMFAGEDANSYFGSGTAGDIYKSYLMNEYGKSIANSGGIGIADTVKQELLKLQEV